MAQDFRCMSGGHSWIQSESSNSLDYYNLYLNPNGGNVCVGKATDDGVNKFQINGSISTTQFRLSALNTAPANPADTGVLGEIRIVNGYTYICVATNT